MECRRESIMRIRKSFIMFLKPGCEAEYKRRHDELWPQLRDVLKSHGVHNYSISLCRETRQLFGYAEIDSEAQWESIAGTRECRDWWKYLSDIMETNADNSPRSTGLAEMFHLE